jgi:hypothetical protein
LHYVTFPNGLTRTALACLFSFFPEKNKISTFKACSNCSSILFILQTPVLLLLFNRPDFTRELLKQIIPLSDARIYIAADGPRKSHTEDTVNCAAVRKLADDAPFASKQVFKLYRSDNLGCRHGVKDALDWFFSREERGIILEDDCIPDPSFFPFCEQLLEKYAVDEQVFAISGDNFLLDKIRLKESYYFTRYFHAWGWATWKRAWQKYDFEMRAFPEFIQRNGFEFYHMTENEKKYWTEQFSGIYNQLETVNSWAYPFSFSVWANQAVCIAPAKNLVRNTGFENSGTHTIQAPYWYKYLETGKLDITSHPDRISIHEDADRCEFNNIILQLYRPPLLKRIWYALTKSVTQ